MEDRPEECSACVVGVCCARGAAAKWAPAAILSEAAAVEEGVAGCAGGMPGRRAGVEAAGGGLLTTADTLVPSAKVAEASLMLCMPVSGCAASATVAHRRRAGRPAQRVRDRRRRCERDQGQQRTARAGRVPARVGGGALAACEHAGVVGQRGPKPMVGTSQTKGDLRARGGGSAGRECDARGRRLQA